MNRSLILADQSEHPTMHLIEHNPNIIRQLEARNQILKGLPEEKIIDQTMPLMLNGSLVQKFDGGVVGIKFLSMNPDDENAALQQHSVEPFTLEGADEATPHYCVYLEPGRQFGFVVFNFTDPRNLHRTNDFNQLCSDGRGNIVMASGEKTEQIVFVTRVGDIPLLRETLPSGDIQETFNGWDPHKKGTPRLLMAQEHEVGPEVLKMEGGKGSVDTQTHSKTINLSTKT